jgi:hypothetical protein
MPRYADSTQMLMNTTFTLDSEPAGNFLHSGSVTIHGLRCLSYIFPFLGSVGLLHTLGQRQAQLGFPARLLCSESCRSLERPNLDLFLSSMLPRLLISASLSD